MGCSIEFVVDGEPQGKARPRVVGGRAFTPDKTVSYEQRVATAFRQAYPGWEPWEKGIPLRMDIIAFYKIPKSASLKAQTRMKMGEIRPTKKPDIDNICKIIADACNGLVYHDDAQIVVANVIKRYDSLPGVVVAFEEID